MSQVKLSKNQLEFLDLIIEGAQKKGHTTLGSASPECWFDCYVNVTVPVLTATVEGIAHKSGPISVAKLIEYRKTH